MWSGRFGATVLGLGLLGLGGCEQHGSSTFGGPDTLCHVPCKDDPSKTCTVPCMSGGPGTFGSSAGGAGAGGSGGAGGTGGAAVESVDVEGTVVQVEAVTFDFDFNQPYLDAISIVAPGFATTDVQTDASGGSFTLTGAASGIRWVLAKELDGAGGAFSTYALQDLNGQDKISVPVVPQDLLETIAAQIDVPSLTSQRAHLVVEIDDANGDPSEGATLALDKASIGYAIGTNQFSASAEATGPLGLATALNIPAAAPSDVEVSFNAGGVSFTATLKLAPDTVTYARVAAPP